MLRKRSVLLAVGLLLGILAAGCSKKPAQPEAAEASQDQPKEFVPVKLPAGQTAHLPNAIRVHEKVISGGLPEGEEGFRELAQLGVKTVVSVDGARPDVEGAKKFGLRYVHLPHGYDGVPEERAKELAKAVRELPGTIYIHCHHGKHRSPAATAVACVGGGLLPASGAMPILKLAGTSENYKGLFESAEGATAIDAKTLKELPVEFVERAKLPAMAQSMVEIEHAHDHLKLIAAAGWKTPKDHPALVPAHEALLLREHFTELLRTDEVQKMPARFQELTKQNEQACEALEQAIRAWEKEGGATPSKEIGAAMDRVTKSCTVCHKEFRDVPLREKLKASGK